MGYAENVIRELLFEEVAQNKVVNAVKRRHEVSFRYDSGDSDVRGKGIRVYVQPVAVGTTKSGNPCFRGYQTNGSSESAEKGDGKLPGWRLFLLDKVVPNTWKDTGKVFNEPPMYNRNGDKTMATVLVQADFEGASARYNRGGLKAYNAERHAKNVEKNPFYDFEKQLKKKTMASDDIMRRIQSTSRPEAERQREWNAASVEANKGNAQSIEDMSRVTNFGDDMQTETSGPIKKGEYRSMEQQPQQPTQMNYSGAKQNGPVYKGDPNKEEENNEENGR